MSPTGASLLENPQPCRVLVSEATFLLYPERSPNLTNATPTKCGGGVNQIELNKNAQHRARGRNKKLQALLTFRHGGSALGGSMPKEFTSTSPAARSSLPRQFSRTRSNMARGGLRNEKGFHIERQPTTYVSAYQVVVSILRLYCKTFLNLDFWGLSSSTHTHCGGQNETEKRTQRS